MIVRQIDGENDWTFGKGKNNYLSDQAAIAQTIQTRLQSFLGDCFFATNEGIDWFHLLGGKSTTAITNAVVTTIVNTPNITGLVEVSLNVDNNRKMTINYKATTAYSTETILGSVTVGA